MTNIFKLFGISEDPLYMKGIAEGRAIAKAEGKIEGKIESIESFIIKTDFDDESIANLLSVSLDLVKKTRQNLKKH